MNILKQISLSIFIILVTSFQIIAEHKKGADSLNSNTYDVYEMIVIQKGDTNAFTRKSKYKVYMRKLGQQKSIDEYLNEQPGYEKSNHDSLVKKNFSEEKIYLALGTGFSLPPFYRYGGYKGGINLQFNVMKIMSRKHAIRGDFQFMHNPASKDFGTYMKEGNMNTYAIKFDFLLGNFGKISIVNGYALLGGGLNIMKQGDTKYTYNEYNYNTMTYTGRQTTYIQKNKAQTYFNLDCGGGLIYNVSDKYKIFGEAQYSFPVAYMGEYGSIGLEGVFSGSPSLRLGVQIGL